MQHGRYRKVHPKAKGYCCYWDDGPLSKYWKRNKKSSRKSVRRDGKREIQAQKKEIQEER